MDVEEFISRWRQSGGSERANFQTFANELTDLLAVPRPDPATAEAKGDGYRFKRPVTFIHTGSQTRGFIDLYRAGHFVMEAKQGTEGAKPDPEAQLSLLPDLPTAQRKGHGQRGSRAWDDTMLRARSQADSYARAVSRTDGWPPFLLIVDVGHVIEVYADFSGQGQGYTQFPDGNRYRIKLDDLRDEATRERLRLIWTNPHVLDPAKTSARVTREVADRLAALGKSYEGKGHTSETIASFLMRCLFTMFAEDVELIPKGSFSDLLKRMASTPAHAQPMLKSLWQTMDTGGFSPALNDKLIRFNGGLFKDADALPLTEAQLSLLIDAANRDWREVEPAIFGTLLERALSPKDRHKLGAHYTPRAYVERLVAPTLIEPLRADWAVAQAAALTYARDGQMDQARAAVRDFHAYLCRLRVLDPACGSGNFLYVALELMKRLEGEVVALLRELGDQQQIIHIEENGEATYTIDPHQFLGLELNPWAAAVAELVLWIGYLQWHFRTHGRASPAEPVLRDFHNIENRDAVLTWASRTPRVDADGKPVTRWDGETTIVHPVTGEDVPDPAARVQVYDYAKPAPAKWPEADFIIGNPPFIGNKRMRDALGDGYTEALWAAYPRVPQSADFVMFWWEKAALAARGFKPATDKTRAKGTRRFGLITTNSITMVFNRRVIEPHLIDEKSPLSLLFAIPDHPWVDASDGAAVRIAITVAAAGRDPGRLVTVIEERKGETEAEGRPTTFAFAKGKLFSDLNLGADVVGCKELLSNKKLAFMGVIPHGEGMVVDGAVARKINPFPELPNSLLRPYCNGKELIAGRLDRFVIDAFPMTASELRLEAPSVFQWLLDTVKPVRDVNRDKDLREKWWLHRRNNGDLRAAQRGLPRFIATIETSKHRTFSFLPGAVLPDQKLRIVSSADACILAVLSSQFHLRWATVTGGTLEDRPVYNHSVCFNPFPFPTPTAPQTARLRLLGEELDAHRKAQQAAHPKLTLTAMYNVLEKLRAVQRIEGRDRETYDQGLIGILRDLHDQIDAAVAEAYGWPADLSEADILQRLVDLNHERRAEEARGLVRWLRPEYQNPGGKAAAVAAEQSDMDLGPTEPTAKTPWPKSLPEQIAAVRAALQTLGEGSPADIARQFQRARQTSVQPLLESLALLGQARLIEGNRFAA